MTEQDPQVPIADSDVSETDYLDATPSTGGGPRWGLAALAGIGVAAVAAAGFGVAQLMGAPGSPADAVPANALAYASLDLDPSASQKIAAIRMLRSFPALRDELDLDARDDVRRYVFERAVESATCGSVSYDDDVAPWIGDRVAVAAMPDQGATVTPVVALQVSDAAAAEAGLRALAACADEPLGVAFTGDYAVLAEDQDAAESYAVAAEASPLADDPEFVAWTGRVGDPGIVNGYLAADAPARLMDVAAYAAGEGYGSTAPDDPDAFGPGVAELYRDFQGGAAVLRFGDDRLEVAIAAEGMPSVLAPVAQSDSPTDRAPSIAELPASTAAAFALTFPDDWLDQWVTSLSGIVGGAPGASPDEFWGGLESETGLHLPEDLETLLGRGVRVSVDSSLQAEALSSGDVPTAPVGVRIHGDQPEIDRIVDTLLAKVPPPDREVLRRASGDGYVVLGLDQAYVDQLAAGDGGLGETDVFADALPEADRVSGALYVDFDADDWATRLAGELASGDPALAANIDPLDALGLSSWVDGEGVQRGQLVLTTD